MKTKLTIEQTRQLKHEATNLHTALFRLMRNGGDLNRLCRLMEMAERRYDRRKEADADLRWPNRHKKISVVKCN